MSARSRSWSAKLARLLQIDLRRKGAQWRARPNDGKYSNVICPKGRYIAQRSRAMKFARLIYFHGAAPREKNEARRTALPPCVESPLHQRALMAWGMVLNHTALLA
jgi:hypothetical protein